MLLFHIYYCHICWILLSWVFVLKKKLSEEMKTFFN